MEEGVRVSWLSTNPLRGVGVTWGVPWPQGILGRDEMLRLSTNEGEDVPVQTWPGAYWADGSVKWTFHAASFDSASSVDYLIVRSGHPKSPERTVRVKETESHLWIDTGIVQLKLDRKGNNVIESVVRDGRQLCCAGRLVCLREFISHLSGERVTHQQKFVSEVSRVVVEQNGPIRAVIRIHGRHVSASGHRAMLPFVLRIYCYAGQESFRMVHTFLYDGNPHEDFIKGIGLEFETPMNGSLFNRHVRFAGDEGFFSESPKNLMTIRTTDKYEDLYHKQVSGNKVELDQEEDAYFLDLLGDSATWGSFKLVQDSADHFSVLKRTKPECCWIKAAEGHRARGLMYCGSEHGGVAFSIKYFWEKHPSSFEIEDLSKELAKCTLWLWSPDFSAMDLRHYDTETHLRSSYEGFEEMRSTPYGIANTNEITIWCVNQTPPVFELEGMVEQGRNPALLHCDPEYYHRAKAFGVWGQVDRTTPVRAFLEDQLEALVQYYQSEVEQRRWYGFWDYGDVMHSYDPVRHTWRYDIGGCAWQNTELVPNMWLWLMFLRTGRADIFRFAESMTRHTSEVDVYHIGEYAGLGSRHNVVHWGCGCKEARISMAGLHRFYYYLTGDERIGDIMNEVKDVDYATERLDPMRAYFPKDEFPTHARVGPDWAAFTSNWMTRWERYEDTFYRDKLRVGIGSFKRMPQRMRSLATHGYDPKTGEVYHMGQDSGHHLAICMGEPQVWLELDLMLQDSEWREMLIEIGEFYNLPKEKKIAVTNGEISGTGYGLPMSSAGLVAYAAHYRSNPELAHLAWQLLLSNPKLGHSSIFDSIESVEPLEFIRSIHEVPWIATNTVSQWSLNVIVCLELIPDEIPETI